MKMSILSIILWPKDTAKTPRRMRFSASGINIVTGKSGTGKSSLLHIVDYCLGSGKCSIPVGHIRNAVSWFGIQISLERGEIVIARRNPEAQDQTTDVYWKEGRVEDPTVLHPEKSMNIDELKRRFNEYAGLSSLGFDPEAQTNNFTAAASFRDLAAFNFQPQHIVANPHALFFKTDALEHRQKLVVVFPLVLGAVTARQLAARWRLQFVQSELARKQRELDQLKSASDQWLGEIRGVYTRARELGLLPSSEPAADDWPAERYLRHLRNVQSDFVQDTPSTDRGSTVAALLRVRELEEAEAELSRQISDRRSSLLRMRRLLSSVTSLGTTLYHQEERLFGLGWFQDNIGMRRDCPFCGAISETARKQIERLSGLALELSDLTSGTVKTSPELEREVHLLERGIQERELDLENVRKEKWQLEDKSSELEERRRTLNNAYRFVGRIEQALETYWRTEDDSELREAVKALEFQVRQLRRIDNARNEQVIVQSALDRFTLNVSAYVARLRLERADDPVHLNIRDLMLEVVSKEGRHDSLWEIGSAENWMGYHVAAMLSLHELFLNIPGCPVPTFLMIDQPSQAYFPDRWPGDARKTDRSVDENVSDESVGRELDERSEDIAGVHRIFETLAMAIERSGEKLQIIVTEHAGEITWRNVKYINLVENWRPGIDDYLVPADWIRPNSEEGSGHSVL